ncbi:hypothetical protein NMY22_g19911 [Coprinellus aureogranulatus]|nr:hypothetical protein NMY22_g19911 [Coprinellus aureogranulatus]
MIIFRVMTGRGFLKDGSSIQTPRMTGATETKPMSTALDFARSEVDSDTRGTAHSADMNEKYPSEVRSRGDRTGHSNV